MTWELREAQPADEAHVKTLSLQTNVGPLNNLNKKEFEALDPPQHPPIAFDGG